MAKPIARNDLKEYLKTNIELVITDLEKEPP